MAYETGTEPTPKSLFDRIVSQVQSTAFMGAGNEWDLVYSYDGWGDANATLNMVIKTFLVPGPTGAGDFYVSLRIEPSAGLNTTNFLFGASKDGAVPPWGSDTWISRGDWSSAGVNYARGDVVRYSGIYYVCDVAHTSAASPNPSAAGSAGIWYALTSTPTSTWFGALLASTNFHFRGYYKLWNGGTGDVKYWLVANAQRLALVTKSDSRYHFGYAGGYHRFGSAAANVLPTLLAANNPSAGDTYLNTDTDHSNFPLSGSNTSNNTVSMKCPGNRTASDGEVYPYPPGSHTAPSSGIGRKPNGDYALVPILLGFFDSGASDDIGVAGTMDGVFGIDNRDAVSENIITVGADNYLMVENVFRGQNGHFLALKLA